MALRIDASAIQARRAAVGDANRVPCVTPFCTVSSDQKNRPKSTMVHVHITSSTTEIAVSTSA
jgi:hypothetical protein